MGGLVVLYQVHLHEKGVRIPVLERHPLLDGVDAKTLSADDLIDLSSTYKVLFSEGSGNQVERLYQDLAAELRRLPFDRSSEIFDALEFIQTIVATAMWRFGFEVGPELSEFARDFDRLDVDHERLRLYQALFQTAPPSSE